MKLFCFLEARDAAIVSGNAGELKTEIVRKTLHFLIALAPGMSAINKPFTMAFLMAGTLGYAFMEYLRLLGVKVPVISLLTSLASRTPENDRFEMGPVTLGLGALFALFLFPYPAAAIAIYALAFGDGFASLAGKFFGKTRPAFLHGKSVEGSFVCFFACFISAYAVSGSVQIAGIAALTAMSVEALPLGDYDNLALPVTVGLAVSFLKLF